MTDRVRARLLAVCVLAFVLGWQNSAADASTPNPLEHFRRGANFGNYLEAPRGQDWGVRYGAVDLDRVKQEGFDHVRLPIAWHHYAGSAPEFKLDPDIFNKVDSLVTNALARGLGIIVNIHHFDAFTSDPEGQTAEFYALWQQIAVHYAGQPDRLAYELLNEPKDKATTELLNPIYAEAISLIRKTNPERTIFLGPSRWNSLDEVTKLQLPPDKNLVVTVHSYEPFYFTHQGAAWTTAAAATTGLRYPGPPPTPISPDPRALKANRSVAKWFENYNGLPASENPCGPKAFVSRMEKVAAWAQEHHVAIHVGEFGAYEKAERESRVRYYRDMRQTAERLGFGWAIWDWKAGFKYWNGDAPVPGMHDALFGSN